MRPHRYFVTGMCALVLAITMPAHAQEAPAARAPSAAGAPAEPAKAEVLSLSKLAEQSGQTTRLSEQATLLAQPAAELEALKPELAAIQEKVDKLSRQTRRQLDGQPGVEQVRATHTEWMYLREQLLSKQKIVLARTTELETAINQLQQQETQWDQIKSQVNTAAVPAEAKKLYGKAIGDIQAAQKTLTASLKGVLSQADDWQSMLDTADNTLLQLKQYESSQRAELLTTMEPPLWTLSLADFEPNDGTRQALRQRLSLIAYYLGQNVHANVGLSAATLTLIVFLWRLRARPDTFTALREGEKLRLALLDRPHSTALAFTAALGLLIYQHPPQMLTNLLALMLLAPVIRIGLPQMPAQLRPLAWLISILFVINNLEGIAEALPALERLWIVGSAAASGVVCLHLLRQLSHQQQSQQTSWKALRATLVLSLVLSLVAMVCGIVGAAALAEFLVTGLTNAAYAGICTAVVTGIASDFACTMLYLPAATRSHLVRHNRSMLTRNIQWTVRALGVIVWLSFSLDQFLIRDDLWSMVSALLGFSLTVGNISVSLGDALAIVITLWLTFKLSKFLQFVFKEDIAPRANLGRGVPDAISTLMHYAIVILGFIIAISAAGIDMSKLAIMAGALGVGIGIGLQDVVNNFTSGLILLFERHIKPGDIIQCSALNGRVMHIGLRSSIVRTFDGAEVIVPNGLLVSAQVINWTHSDQQRRITIPVGVSYGSEPARVIETLMQVAKADLDVLTDPEPSAFFVRFGPSSMDFELRAWVSTGEILNEVTSRLCVEVAEAFKEKGIEIPFPQQDMHLRSLPPEFVQQFNAPRA